MLVTGVIAVLAAGGAGVLVASGTGVFVAGRQPVCECWERVGTQWTWGDRRRIPRPCQSV